MATTPTNPFKKSEAKSSLLSVTLQADQRQLVEALRDHLGLKSNAAVVMEGLAALYDKHRRQLDAGAPAQAE